MNINFKEEYLTNIKSLLKHKLVQAGGWYTFTNFFVKGISFLAIPIFTRILTTEDYGIVSLYLTWVSLFSIFISLDLVWAVQRGKFEHKENFDNYIASVLFLSLILLGVFLFLFIIFDDFFIKLTELPPKLFYFLILHSYFSFVQQFSLAKFRVEYKYKLVSVVNILASVFSVVFSIYLVKNIFIENAYYGRIFGSGLIIIIIGMIYLIFFLVKGKTFINKKYWKYALTLSLPFVLHNISGIINSQFDRIIINKYVGAVQTGIYSFGYSVGSIILIFQNSFAQAYGPFALEKMQNNEIDKIKSVAKAYRVIFIFIYTVFLFVAPELVKIMAEESYWEGLSIIPFIFMANYFVFMNSFEVQTQYYYKETKFKAIGTIIAAVVNVLLNLIFVPYYGYMAAAITTAVSYLIITIFHYCVNKYILKHSMYGGKFHLESLLSLAFITVLYLVFKEQFVIRVLIIIGISLFFFKRFLKIIKI